MEIDFLTLADFIGILAFAFAGILAADGKKVGRSQREGIAVQLCASHGEACFVLNGHPIPFLEVKQATGLALKFGETEQSFRPHYRFICIIV